MAHELDTETAKALSKALKDAQNKARRTYTDAVAAAKLARDTALAAAFAQFTRDLARAGQVHATPDDDTDGTEGGEPEDTGAEDKGADAEPAPAQLSTSSRRRNAA